MFHPDSARKHECIVLLLLNIDFNGNTDAKPRESCHSDNYFSFNVFIYLLKSVCGLFNKSI